MQNIHVAVFELLKKNPLADVEEVHEVVWDLIDWNAWNPGVSSEERDGVTCTLVSRLMKNGRGDLQRACACNVSFSNGLPDINADVYEW